MIQTLRSYMQLATGLIESTSERAKESASALINQGVEAGSKGPEVVSAQVQEIADDLIEQGRTNRELMVGLIRTEVERAVGRMGFVRGGTRRSAPSRGAIGTGAQSARRSGLGGSQPRGLDGRSSSSCRDQSCRPGCCTWPLTPQ